MHILLTLSIHFSWGSITNDWWMWNSIQNTKRNYSTWNPHIQSQIQSYQTFTVMSSIVLSTINPRIVWNAEDDKRAWTTPTSNHYTSIRYGSNPYGFPMGTWMMVMWNLMMYHMPKGVCPSTQTTQVLLSIIVSINTQILTMTQESIARVLTRRGGARNSPPSSPLPNSRSGTMP